MSQSINAHDHIAIQNVLARYCEALDTKIFILLDKVFIPDVVADYPFNSNLKGVDAIRNAIQNRHSTPIRGITRIYLDKARLGPIQTHHSLTTQTIIFGTNPKTANAVTYFTGSHFGQGPHNGKVLQAYGRYVDELVLLEAKAGDCEGVPGASGIWRIAKRVVIFTARIGDENIMREF